MFRSLFSSRTTKADVVFGIAAAVVAVWKAGDTVKKYQTEQDSEKEKDK